MTKSLIAWAKRTTRPLRDWNLHARIRRSVQSRLPALYPRYGLDTLITKFDDIGAKPGATVFMHSSWDEFYNLQCKPVNFLRALIDHLGPQGTLVMPAFPLDQDATLVFDVRRSATGGGYLPEIFRRWPNVKRSININHSVTALGPNADFLTRDHHHSVVFADKSSPFYRLRDVDAVIIAAGLPKAFGYGTAMHCAESVLLEENDTFERVFEEPLTYTYRDVHGMEGQAVVRFRARQYWSPSYLHRYIDREEIRLAHVSNLRLQGIGARYLVDTVIALAREGITGYRTLRFTKN